MEQAVAFREERTRDRLEALAETGFVAVEPLLGLLEDMSQHREVLEEWHADTDVRIPAKWKGQFGVSGRVGSEQEARARSEATLEWI